MQKTKSTPILLGVLVMSFLVGYLVLAWEEPKAAPPDENVPTPLNTSINAQAKEGALVVGVNSGLTTGLVVQYGKVGIGATIPGYRLDVAGDVGANAFYYRSDESLKENIQTLNNALEKITALRGVEFNFKDDAGKEKTIGLIAQEAEEVLPEIVSEAEGSGFKSVDYAKVVPVLIEAIKEQQKEIKGLKSRIMLLEENK